MTYDILPYTYKQAKRLDVTVYPSTNRKYKLDIYDSNGDFVTSVGAAGYSDFPHYIESHGMEYAEKRRALYKKRHSRDRAVIGSRGYWADRLLW